MLHVSKLHINLLSVSKFVLNDLNVKFNIYKCIIKSCHGETIVIAPHEHNFYEINFMEVHKVKAAILEKSPMGDDALEFWHRRFGHLNVKTVHTLKKNCPTFLLLYEACIKDKQHRVVFLNEGDDNDQAFGNCAL